MTKYKFEKKLRIALNQIKKGLGNRYFYYRNTGKRLNINNPTTFNEKIQWLLINWQHPLIIKAADKYRVRDYIKEKGLENILNTVYGVYNNANEIDFDILPQEFVLKTNHGCGSIIIVHDKNSIDKRAIKNEMNQMLKIDYGKLGGEFQYSKIKPLIIAERLINSDDEYLPEDYKIFCFNGEPKFISVVNQRSRYDVKGYINKIYLDLNWQQLLLAKDDKIITENELPKRPERLLEMLDLARELSQSFPFVRVDLYLEKCEIVFGELTFSPSAGLATYFKDETQKELGNMLVLPNSKITQ